MWYTQSLKKNEILIHATMQLYLEDIMLGEISQTKMYKYYVHTLNMKEFEELQTQRNKVEQKL